MSNLNNILQNFWLTEKESKIFIFLYKYWKKPASTIAKSIWDERTNTYKSLQKLVKKWFISEITKDGTKLFFIADKKIFEHKLNSEIEEIEKKKNNLSILEKEFKNLEKESFSQKPWIIFFEWIDWIQKFYDDIIINVSEKWYKQIKFFASNTLENRNSSSFLEYSPNFLKKLKNKNILLDIFIGNWISVFEEIVKAQSIDEIINLPAWDSSIQIFIFWSFVYIVIFKDIPYWIKFESEEFSNIMHFLLKKVNLG